MNKQELKQRVKELELELELVKQQACYNATASSNVTEKYSVLETEIEEYKSLNKSLVQKIDGLLAYQDVMQNFHKALVQVSRRIMSQLAISTVIQMTHRERNEQIRSIVCEIKYVLDKPADQWFTPPTQDMDDIPF